jgi:hypothetical protein
VPFKSEAQKQKMMRLEAEGKLKPGTVAKWAKETPPGKLPERKAPSRHRPDPPKKHPPRGPAAPSYTKRRFGVK